MIEYLLNNKLSLKLFNHKKNNNKKKKHEFYYYI